MGAEQTLVTLIHTTKVLMVCIKNERVSLPRSIHTIKTLETGQVDFGSITPKNIPYTNSENTLKFCGLPKIHKKDTPALRPIVSSISNISYHMAQFLASALHPLVGNTIHACRTGEDFVRNLETVVSTNENASCDITAIFMTIPVEKAIMITCWKLEDDDEFANKCELSVSQVIELLKFCLRITYFMCWGVFYRQIQGAAIGSSVSSCSDSRPGLGRL